MREPLFLRQNKDKWLEYEAMLFGKAERSLDPDRLAELYIQLTDDLAYARTFYPKSQSVRYLNGLAARTHLAIYRNKKQKKNRLFTFWAYELPMINRLAHRHMLLSFVIFTLCMMMGLLSAIEDKTIPVSILGQGYVSMTIDNIRGGDPMGVYKREESSSMFLRIAVNNIGVSFRAFASGILLSVGTLMVLFYNGFMVGAFFGFLHTETVLWEALPIIYIHGTLELSAIVIAGGAGFMMGNSILFPGTYSRVESLRRAGENGVKILIGLVPVFTIAAFLEGFITRLTEMPLAAKLAIIILSLVFLIWYYIIYPIQISRKLDYERYKPD